MQDSTPGMRAIPVRREWQGRGGSLAYWEWKTADGLPPLHFAHANGFNGQTYHHLLGRLASRFHIRAWDARGHGASTLEADPSNHKSWDVFRDDLSAFMESFVAETGKPVLLAGHSMGGTISILTAACRPDLVRGLFLAEPVFIPSRYQWMQRLVHFTGYRFSKGLVAGALGRQEVWPDKQTVMGAYRGRGAFKTWLEPFLADYIEGGFRSGKDGQVVLACSPAWEAANFRVASWSAVWPAIRCLKTPLTLLYAGIGSTAREPGPFRLAKADPQGTICRFENATHFLPMEYPDRLVEKMLAFNTRLETLQN